MNTIISLNALDNTFILFIISSITILISWYLNIINYFQFRNKFFNKWFTFFQKLIQINIFIFLIPKYIIMIITDNLYLTFILFLMPYTYFIFLTFSNYIEYLQLIRNQNIFYKIKNTFLLFKNQIILSAIIIAAEIISDYSVVNYFNYNTITLSIFNSFINYLNIKAILVQILILFGFIFLMLLVIFPYQKMFKKDLKLIQTDDKISIEFFHRNINKILFFIPFLLIIIYLLIFDFNLISFVYYLLKNIWFQSTQDLDLILNQIRIFFNSIIFASSLSILTITIAILLRKFMKQTKILYTLFFFFYFIPNLIFVILGMYLSAGIYSILFLIIKYLNLALVIHNHPDLSDSFWIEIRQLRKIKKINLIFIFKQWFNHYNSVLKYAFIIVFLEIFKEVPITLFTLSDKITLSSFLIYNNIKNENFEAVSLLIILNIILILILSLYKISKKTRNKKC